MNYECRPDLSRKCGVTVDAVALFQRFRQESDVETVNQLFAEEFARYRKLCELAILHNAAADIYWCELPGHSLPEVQLHVERHLSEVGFKVEQHAVASTRHAAHEHRRDQKVAIQVMRSFTTVSWLTGSLDQKHVAAEWSRREAVEDRERAAHPPTRVSSGTGNSLDAGSAIWAATDAESGHVVEVQRIHHRNFLCIFSSNGKCVHHEPTAVAFGAMFGPDICDVNGWMQRATVILKTIGPA